ncbi:hypothetical protein F4859DRAFT_463258 [Xylaria cf. heliscus]|nr:hypothetical protein F4859DRAFT_463258 [Xylaria cf. heliscus]
MMTNLSIEAIVAIVAVIVSLPPTVLVLMRYVKRRHEARQDSHVEPHTIVLPKRPV